MKTFTQRCSQLNWRTFIAGGFKTFLVLFLLTFLTPDLNAQITVNGQPGDWCSVIGGAKPNLHVRDILNGGNDDTEFTEGTSDVLDIPDWVWGLGVISDKTDLGNVGLVVDGCTVYFFADRYAVDGDADLGLWLFKNPDVSLNPDGSFNGTHQEGDILITSKFTNGGGEQTTKVYIWTGGELVLLFDTALDASKESIASGTVNSSDQAVPCGWDYDSKTAAAGIYPTGSFYEGRIDLCLLEEAYTQYSLAINECFANFIFKTSQSPSPTSANGDLVFGNINSLPEEPEVTGSSFCAGSGPGTVSVANSSASVRYYLEIENGGDWDPVANSLGNGSTLTFNGLEAGTYRVRAVNINTISLCETISESVDVIETPAPNANAGADKELTCTTTSLQLSGSSTTAGATFSWVASNGGFIVSGALTATPTVNAAGTYTLTVTADGCTATDVALVTLDNTPPNANAGADKELTCTTTSIQLSGSSSTAGATFSWVASNGGNITAGALTATPTVNAAGTYTLTVTDPSNGCTATDVALVTLDNTAPNANAGADKELTCTTTSLQLSGSSSTAGATFSWVASNGGNITAGALTATPTVNAAGTYTLTVTDPSNGCTATDVALVTLNNTAPNANAGADKELTCTVTSIMLSGSSTTVGATFSWVASNGGNITAGALTATPTVNAAGTYTLTVTDPSNGCTATDVALVTLDNTAPNANAGADKELTCTTTSIMLSGSSTTVGATFSWVASNGGNITAGALTATPTVNAAGTYTLTVTDPSNGCTAMDVALVTLDNTAPNANAGADKELTCTITSIMLSGSSTTVGATFSWVASNGGNITAGALTATPTVNAAGTYTLTVTDPSNGCTAMDVALVTLDNTTPNANAGADKELTCTTTSIILAASLNPSPPDHSYSWVASNGGNITAGALTATPTVNAAGTYTLTVTNLDNGCTATDVALVTLNNTPPNANAGADKELTCTVTSIMLSGSSTTAGATFSWVASNGGNITGGALTATPTVNAAGTYTLTVTNPANGCTATDVALVTLNNTPPNANAGADKEIPCGYSTVMLSGSSTTAGATFSWVASNGGNIVSGALTATPTVNAAGTYTLTVTNPANGCTATDIALVTIGVCPELFCTYTQGYFGNAGGKACDGETGGLSTTQLINQSISNWGGSILIGSGTRSVTIETGDADWVIKYLPGGGQSYALSGPAIGISSPSFATLYTKKAGPNTKINNTLLAQTITLGLNLGINDDLASFSFATHSAVNKYLVTQEPESCGSTVGVPDSYTCDELNPAVVALLKQANWPAGSDFPATVAGLFQLANYALGGGSLAGTGVDLNSIAGAADAINNAFDECRLFVGFRETCPVPSTTKAETESLSENSVSVTAFPNPYTDRVRFVLRATISGQAALEIYNSMGQRVATPFRGFMNAGSSQVVDYTVPANQRENLFYLMRVNDKQASGKLLNLD